MNPEDWDKYATHYGHDVALQKLGPRPEQLSAQQPASGSVAAGDWDKYAAHYGNDVAQQKLGARPGAESTSVVTGTKLAEPDYSYPERLAAHVLNTAAGIPGVEAVEAGAGALGSRVFGDHPMSYQESLNALRGAESGIAHPTLERVAGAALATPALPLPSGAIGGGATFGAAEGALRADPNSLAGRAWDTARGTAAGAAGGAVVRGGSALAGGIGRAIGNRIAPAAAAASEASGMLGGALRAGGVDIPAAIKALPEESAAPTTMMELGSRPALSVVRAARNTPTSTAAQTTDRFLAERGAGAGRRIEGALTAATGHAPTDTWLPVEQLIEKRAAEAEPMYNAAYAAGHVQDPETISQIQKLLDNPVFGKAWLRGKALGDLKGTNTNLTTTIPAVESPAITTAQSPPPTTRQAVENFWNRQAAAAARKEGTVEQQMARRALDRHITEAAVGPITGENPGPQILEPEQTLGPSVRQIDLWKRGLDAVINSGYGSENAMSRTEAHDYREALNNVLKRVDEEVPAYKAARKNFAGHSEVAADAKAGANHFSPATPTGAIPRQMAEMSDAGREAYRANALNKLVGQIRTYAANPDLPEAGRNTNILQRIMGTADANERLRMLFPDDASYNSFLADVEDEALYPKTSNFMRGQSTTAAQLAERGTSPLEWVDVARHPVRTVAGKLINLAAEPSPKTMSPATANAVGEQATATGGQLRQLLFDMEKQRMAQEVARRRVGGIGRALGAGVSVASSSPNSQSFLPPSPWGTP